MSFIMIVLPVILLLLLLWLTLQYSLLVPAPRGLRILMYHKIAATGPDGLTVTTAQFDQHLKYLKEKGYHPITFAELHQLQSQGKSLPEKAVILTFDDAYTSFHDLAIPLLQKYGFSATLFVPVAFIGKTNIWDHGDDHLLPAGELKDMALEGNAEIGLHSYHHKSYGDMTPEEMEEDLRRCYTLLDAEQIPFIKVLAYPYGGYPKHDPVLKAKMIELFKRTGLLYALRIGNRVNPWPTQHPYELKRTDIRGSDSFFVFRAKVQKGRAKLFS